MKRPFCAATGVVAVSVLATGGCATNEYAGTLAGGGIGKLPVDRSLRTYHNVEKPDFGADWQLQFQVQFLLPK